MSSKTEEELDEMAATTDKDNGGFCGFCQEQVFNPDPIHRITSLTQGGKGVECKVRGDYGEKPEHPDWHPEFMHLITGAEPEHKAPSGMYRVLHVDTFSNDGATVEADWASLKLAKECADAHGGEMSKTHVYDDLGNHLYEAGTF